MEKYKSAITYGLISGVVIVLYHLGFHFASKYSLTSSWFFFSIYILHVPFMIMSGLTFRKNNEGLVEFRIALREVFITFLVGTIIYYICYYVIFNIDAELITMQKQRALENIQWLESQAFYDEDEIAPMKEALENSDYTVTIGNLIKGIPFRLLGGFGLSALVAVMVKR